MKKLALATAFFLLGCASAPGIAVRQPGESEAEYLARYVRTEAGFVCDGESLCIEAQLAARERVRAIRIANEPAPGRSIQVGGERVSLSRGTGSPDKLAAQRAITDALAQTLVRIGRTYYVPDWIAAETRLHELLEARGIAPS